MELLFFGLEGDDLVVVEFVAAEDLVVKPLGLFSFVAAHVLDDLLAGQVHHTVEPMHKPQRYLLPLLAQLLLGLELFPDWRALLAANRGILTLLLREALLLSAH